MKIREEYLKRLERRFNAMRDERLSNWRHWRELADYYLPRRYVWLLSDHERNQRVIRNPNILDGTGTVAARTLASGMANGITSPARPWFKLRLAGFADEASTPVRRWLDEVARRMMLVMSESNFYNGLSVLYLDLSVFGTASMMIYEDYESVINCYNPALGEFYLSQNASGRVNVIGREFTKKVHQLVEEYGIDNVSDRVKIAYDAGGARLQEDVMVRHLIEPNDDRAGELPKNWKFREYYWEVKSDHQDRVLRERGYNDFPSICPRWEVTGNDVYGVSPAADALGDVIQLQHETKRKAQGLDKLINPPVIADIQLEHRKTPLIPGGVTYVAGMNQSPYGGVRPVYQISGLQIDAISQDIAMIQQRIRETFHNDLFRMISQLDTVRSAAEIDARREEKLVLLGPVLERFESEALDPALSRIFHIMTRARLFPEPPPEARGQAIEIKYVSILAVAQSAVAAAPTERFLGVIGQIAPVVPDVLTVPKWTDLMRSYAQDIGVPSKNINSEEESQQALAAQQQQQQAAQTAQTSEQLTSAAANLSKVEVGGGANAVQRLLGG